MDDMSAETTASVSLSELREELRSIEFLDGLDESQLDWFAQHGTVTDLDVGQRLVKEGDPAEEMFIQLSGAIQIVSNVGGQRMIFDTIKRGAVTGLLPHSRMKIFAGTGIPLEPSRLLKIHKSRFDEMLRLAPQLGQRLSEILTDRVRLSTRNEQQREKMVALGRLSAGLAHELNNPAAAAKRAASQLRNRMKRLPELLHRLTQQPLSRERIDALNRSCPVKAKPGELSALERNEREEEMADWLEDVGVEEPWDMAASFVESGLRTQHLREAVEGLEDSVAVDLVAWLENGLALETIADEVEIASQRVFELVKSVKSYTYRDQAPEKVLSDLHEGLDDALLIFGHRIKRKNVQVVRLYDEDLPEVPIFVSDLNQVWSNLIDNALEAMPDEDGRLTIKTWRDERSAFVSVADNGRGIPEDVQQHIFEPFFTTKPVGEGTGLGLDISYRIIEQHEGTINVKSIPGGTCFTVCLPYVGVDGCK